jgi:hypothetical protein
VALRLGLRSVDCVRCVRVFGASDQISRKRRHRNPSGASLWLARPVRSDRLWSSWRIPRITKRVAQCSLEPSEPALPHHPAPDGCAGLPADGRGGAAAGAPALRAAGPAAHLGSMACKLRPEFFPWTKADTLGARRTGARRAPAEGRAGRRWGRMRFGLCSRPWHRIANGPYEPAQSPSNRIHGTALPTWHPMQISEDLSRFCVDGFEFIRTAVRMREGQAVWRASSTRRWLH